MNRVSVLFSAAILIFYSNVALAQTIDLTVDQSNSFVTIFALGEAEVSSLTGVSTLELTPASEPFDLAHVATLDLSMADGFIIDTGLVDIIVEPDGASVFFTEVGDVGTVDGNNQFDQFGNIFGIAGEAVVDPLIGPPDVIDLGTVKPVQFDIMGAQLEVSGSTITLTTDVVLNFEFELPIGGSATMTLDGVVVLNGELPAGVIGDVNCDGMVDLLDVSPFVQLLASGGFSDKADINADGVVDLLDVSPFVALLAGG